MPVPIAQWKFDSDTTTVATDSIGGYNGTYIGGYVLTPTGVPNPGVPYIRTSGLLLNGSNSYVDIPNISINDLISVGAWVNYGNASQNAMIVGKEPVNTQWNLRLEGGNLKWNGGSAAAISATAPIANRWHYVTATQSGTYAELYIDGIRYASGTVATIGNGTSSSGNKLAIGRYNNSYYYNGLIDEVSIYNYNLSQSDISSNYVQYEFGASGRVSQTVAEVVYSPPAPLLRSSQSVAEISYTPQNNLLRATQLPIEVLYVVYNSGVHAPSITSFGATTNISANGIYTLTGSIGSGTSGASGTTHDINAVLGVVYKGTAPVNYDVTTAFDAMTVQSNSSGVLDPSSSGVSYIIDPNSIPHMIHIIYEDVIVTRDPYVENTNFDYLNRRYTSPKYYKKRGF